MDKNTYIQKATLEDSERMTSLQIAEITGKPHNDVMKAIRKMEPAWEKVHQGKFSLMSRKIEIGNGARREVPCYELTKTECLYIATKFNDEARAKLVLRWEQLEMERQQPSLPTTYKDALKQLLLQVEANEHLQIENEKQRMQIEKKDELITQKDEQVCQLTDKVIEMGKKVSYLDQILANKSTILTTSIAQDYGMSAKAFNRLLNRYGIQHKVDKQWILYAPYLTEGYVHSKQIEITHADGSKKIHLNTEWTQKGRLFLYQKLKSKGVVPMIER